MPWLSSSMTAAGSWMMDLFSAKGNAFDGVGNVQKFANGGTFTNQIVNSPTLFKFAKGTGMMGEAGPEAIMPLTRGPDGKLGVQASGSAGGNNVVVNIQPPAGHEAQVSQRSDSGVDVIDVVFSQLDARMATGITQGSSKTAAAAQQTWGLNRAVGGY